MAWLASRQANTEKQVVPGWTGFNIKTHDSLCISQDIIGYLPTINSPATDMCTVYEILNQSDIIRKELKLNSIVIVMDQALFAKAAEIVWKQRKRYEKIILRMGAFHKICNFFLKI